MTRKRARLAEEAAAREERWPQLGNEVGCSSHYELGGQLGAGSFGSVRLATHRPTGKTLACKLMAKADTSMEDACQEERIMRDIGSHRHIIRIYDAFELPNAWALVLEPAFGGEVFDRICEHGAFSEASAARVVRQVALALEHLHSLSICHRDLKPENLLHASAAAGSDVKVADFGLAAYHEPPHMRMLEVVGTASYTAPEVLEPPEVSLAHGGGAAPGYSKAVDLFSLGCLLYTLLAGHTPFDPDGHADNVTIQRRVLDSAWAFARPQWAHVSPDAKSIIAGLLCRQPAERMTAAALLATPWAAGHVASGTPLPGSECALRSFNAARRVWRAAFNALQMGLLSPARGSPRWAGSPGLAAGSPPPLRIPPSLLMPGPASDGAVAGAGTPRLASPALLHRDLSGRGDGNGAGVPSPLMMASRASSTLRARSGDRSSAGARVGRGGNSDASDDNDRVASVPGRQLVTLPRPARTLSEAELRATFSLFDRDGDSVVAREDLRQAWRSLGESPPSCERAARTGVCPSRYPRHPPIRNRHLRRPPGPCPAARTRPAHMVAAGVKEERLQRTLGTAFADEGPDTIDFEAFCRLSLPLRDASERACSRSSMGCAFSSGP